MKNLAIITISSIILLFNSANAQYNGPSNTSKTTTIEAIKKNASQLDKTDALVKVEGFVIQKINKDTYWFQDATGKILVEIDQKDLPSFPFDDKTKLIIIAEVDYDLLEEVELEVETIQIAQ